MRSKKRLPEPGWMPSTATLTGDAMSNCISPVYIEGYPMRWDQMKGGKFFHASPRALPVGTILEPGHGKNFRQSSSHHVSVTSCPFRAIYWVRKAGSTQVHLYEVEPQGAVDPWRVSFGDDRTEWILWEGRVGNARILREVNQATLPWAKPEEILRKARELQ